MGRVDYFMEAIKSKENGLLCQQNKEALERPQAEYNLDFAIAERHNQTLFGSIHACGTWLALGDVYDPHYRTNVFH